MQPYGRRAIALEDQLIQKPTKTTF
jgi:hypothetical protein